MAQLTDLLNDIREGNYKDANATIFDALYLKIEESIEDRKKMSEASDNGDEEDVQEGLDAVDKKELKGKHKDRDDKDIDNDGDVDSSDKYLHKRRKAVSKAVKEDDEKDFKPHMMYDPKTGKGYKADTYKDHLRMDKMGYTHEKPEVKEGAEMDIAKEKEKMASSQEKIRDLAIQMKKEKQRKRAEA